MVVAARATTPSAPRVAIATLDLSAEVEPTARAPPTRAADGADTNDEGRVPRFPLLSGARPLMVGAESASRQEQAIAQSLTVILVISKLLP